MKFSIYLNRRVLVMRSRKWEVRCRGSKSQMLEVSSQKWEVKKKLEVGGGKMRVRSEKSEVRRRNWEVKLEVNVFRFFFSNEFVTILVFKTFG